MPGKKKKDHRRFKNISCGKITCIEFEHVEYLNNIINHGKIKN